MTANLTNKYIKINSYELFLSNIDNKSIQMEGEKVLVRKGTLAERVVSYNLSNEKLKLIDRIKNFILSIFSEEYRAAKVDLKKRLVKYHTDYKNDPYVILYQHLLGEKLKENPPMEKMGEIAKNVKTKVNTYSRKEVQEYVNNLQAEKTKAAVQKEEKMPAEEANSNVNNGQMVNPINNQNESQQNLQTSEQTTTQTTEETTFQAKKTSENESVDSHDDQTSVTQKEEEITTLLKEESQKQLKRAQEEVEMIKEDITNFERQLPSQGIFGSLLSKSKVKDERTPEQKQADKKYLEDRKFVLKIAQQKLIIAQSKFDAIGADENKKVQHYTKMTKAEGNIKKLTESLISKQT